VQTVEVWMPPDTWQGISGHLANLILTEIAAGLPDGAKYSAAKSATDRAAWRVVLKHGAEKTEAQARIIIKQWLKSGVLEEFTYHDETQRKPLKGLRVNNAKRPT
jgi:hypothetical protein